MKTNQKINFVFKVIFFSTLYWLVYAIVLHAEAKTPEEFVKTVENTIPSAVSIIGLSGGGNSTCSGVLIENTDTKTAVLTAKHCIRLTTEMYVEGILVKDIKVSIDNDLAYLTLESKLKDKKTVVISKNKGKRSDIVFHIGYPYVEVYIQAGYIYLTSKNYQYAKMKIIPGCSGGGAFNEEGELIGIVWGSIEERGITSFEPLDDINEFLSTIK